MGTIALQDVNIGEWLPGTVIAGKYALLEKLDDDGAAVLYRAETVYRQEPRLLRALNARSSEHPVIVREFREISELARKISHPNLALVEALGESDGRPFAVTAAVEGRTLQEVVQDEGPLDSVRVCSIARDIAVALEAAHRLGMLHLGLEPRQIVVSGPPGEEHVTVNGLGWAHLRMSRVRRLLSGDTSSGNSLTIEDLLPAAPAYCAPEAALSRSAESLDGRADLYSLGVLAYELLMGRLPRSAAPPDDDGLGMLVTQVDPLPQALEFDPSVPSPLASLIRQLLETRRELRPSTAKVVKEWFGRAARAAAPARPARETVASRQKQPVAIPKPIPPVAPQAIPPPAVVETAPVAAAGPLIPEPIASEPAAPQAPVEPPAPPAPEPRPESLLQPEPLASAVSEPLPEREEPEEQVIADHVPAPEPEPALEPVPPPADVFAELNLEPPVSIGPPAPSAPIVLRPGGRVIHETVPAAGPMAVLTGPAQTPVPFGGPDSVLFKASHPQPPAGWGRRALAALAVASIFAAALFFIRESRKLHWNSPVPTAVDQEHSLSRPDANTEVTPSASQAKSPSNTAPPPIAPSSNTPPQTQPEPSSTPPVPESAGATPAAQNPATGAAGGAAGASAAGANKPSAQESSRAAADAAAAEIQRAVSAGDVFYQTGQYDLAIKTYDQALQDHPQSEVLRRRIARARRARAAEQEYLGQ
jgi:serine/threonine protein kinase